MESPVFCSEVLQALSLQCHAKELADLAVKLDEAGSHAAYYKVMDAVACFEQGNAMLAEVLKELGA